MTLIKDFTGIAIYVTDLERSKAFYTEVLEFEITYEMDYGIFIKHGDITGYIEGKREGISIPPLKHPCICPVFTTESTKEAFDLLSSKGIRIVEEYRKFTEEFAMFSIADPDGNVIEFSGKP